VRLLALDSMLKGGGKEETRRKEEGRKRKERARLISLARLQKGAPGSALLLGAKRTIYFLGAYRAESGLFMNISEQVGLIPLQCAMDRHFGRAG
jgi:hypothetical protein